MNRTFSTLAVFAMLLMAVGICLKQTIEFREMFANSTIAILFAAQAVFTDLVLASGVWLVRKRFARQKKPVTRRPVPVTAWLSLR